MSAGVVLLPHVVVCGEEDEVAAEVVLEGLDRGLLVGSAWDGNAVGISLPWPSRLSDDGPLATAGILNALGLVLDERAGLVGSLTAVEEGVAVSSSVVGSLADGWVGDHGDEGVNGHNVSVVASSLQNTTGSADGSNDSRGGSALVDELVANADGVDHVPVALRSVDDGLGLGGTVGDIVDSDKKLHVLRLGGSHDVLDLAAVGAVKTNHAIAGDLLEVALHLICALAAAIVVVRRVRETEARSAASAARAWWRRLGRSSWSLRSRRRRRVRWRSWGRRRLWLLLLGRSGRWGSGSRSLVGGRSSSSVASGHGLAIAVDVDNGVRGSRSDDVVLGLVDDVVLLLVEVKVVAHAVDLRSGTSSQGCDSEKTGLHGEDKTGTRGLFVVETWISDAGDDCRPAESVMCSGRDDGCWW